MPVRYTIDSIAMAMTMVRSTVPSVVREHPVLEAGDNRIGLLRGADFRSGEEPIFIPCQYAIKGTVDTAMARAVYCQISIRCIVGGNLTSS